jgi:hypothetical protein
MKIIKSIFLWILYVSYSITLTLYYFFRYNLFPKSCPNCFEKLNFRGMEYEWEINPNFTPTHYYEKYPYNFLTCQNCKTYFNLDKING